MKKLGVLLSIFILLTISGCGDEEKKTETVKQNNIKVENEKSKNDLKKSELEKEDEKQIQEAIKKEREAKYDETDKKALEGMEKYENVDLLPEGYEKESNVSDLGHFKK